MLPGKRTSEGAIYVLQGPPPAGTPLVGGIAVSPAGVIYASQAFAWSPASLFAAGEQGAWYDPSDLTTMFQDRAGTTPVTADGQPVGLILDKSKGLVLGTETVTLPYTILSLNWSVSGTSYIKSLGGPTSGAPLNIPDPTVGKSYKVTFTASGLSGGTCYLNFGLSLSSANGRIATAKDYSFILTARSTEQLQFVPYEGSDFAVTISNISVKELAGNHAVAPNDSARPLYKVTGLAKWNDFDAVDDVLNTTFPSSLGSACTVARANVGSAATILTAQTIGTSYANSTDNAGLVITNDALTTQETADLTAWLTAKGATS